MEQRSEEWFAIRLGKVTASRIADVVVRTKSGYGASRANYMAELIAERLTGRPAERFQSAAMAWGTETEATARVAYEGRTGSTVLEGGFVPHPTISNTGASPDGYVDLDGLIEIKCPNTATHIDTLITQTVPERYLLQMQWQMVCAERLWCDFVSFDPRMPDSMQMFIKRVERDQPMIHMLQNEVTKFLVELDDKLVALRKAVENQNGI